ncbi:MAG: radical SAM family heme chaperone HemW [Phocaeicola sp.]
MAGIYLHIPFCKMRCIYCDFYSTTQSNQKEAYIQALCKELVERKEYLQQAPIKTIYLGGGTPSQLSENDFEHLFETIYTHYQVVPDAEITLEANPDDLTPSYLASLRRLPFNRISMGVQTFHEATLKLLKRRHTAQQAIDAYNGCREAGFQNISLDLMYGLPGETLSIWEKDLEQILALRPEHISAYHLIYEEDTVLWKLRETNRVEEANEEDSLRFFEQLIERLKGAGYEQYEISNFSLPGLHSKHNSSYWTGEPYIGCGPSAHSYNGESRMANVASLKEYLAGIEQGTSISEVEELELYTRYNDFVIISLRTMWGLSLPKLKEQYGTELYEYCLRMAAPYIAQQKLEQTEEKLRFTQAGIFLSDGIMSELLWVEE